jgi:hypothetical protein
VLHSKRDLLTTDKQERFVRAIRSSSFPVPRTNARRLSLPLGGTHEWMRANYNTPPQKFSNRRQLSLIVYKLFHVTPSFINKALFIHLMNTIIGF